MIWRDYEVNLEGNLQNLHRRVHRGTYRAMPVRRRLIPKADSKQRPLGITTLEYKIAQPSGRHGAQRDLRARLSRFLVRVPPGARSARRTRRVVRRHRCVASDWILDADIRSFFDRIDQPWLMRFLEHPDRRRAPLAYDKQLDRIQPTSEPAAEAA